MTIVVEVLPDAGAPQVGITVTGLPSGGTSVVSIERSTDGVRWEPVRGALREAVTGSGFFRDFVPPLNVETTYRLVTTAAASGTTAASITVASESAWLQDPLDPRSAVAVTYLPAPGGVQLLAGAAAEITSSMQADVVQTQGARQPVASLGVRQAPANVPLAFVALASAQGALVKSIRELLDTAGTVVVRGLPPFLPLDPTAHVISPEVRERPSASGSHTVFELSVTQVRAPSPRLAVPWWTYDQVRALWAGFSYDSVKAARPGATYLDWLRDPTPEAS